MSQSFYITTPLYYVNDAPHIGHAYTTIAADVMARYNRLRGRDVHFLTGTDEHGQKVFRKAQERGLTAQAHVDELVQRFQQLWVRLDITHDDFIRTTEPRHKAVVQRVLTRLWESGEIYKESYAGWYSTSAERFWTEKDILDGPGDTKLCPDTKQPVEWLEETNYFFRMSKYGDALRNWLEANPDWIQPEARRNELAGALRKEVGDLCITRPKTRLPWGIEIPWDSDYVTYVWFDALLNYVSAVGYTDDDAAFEHRWPADFQLLGKDILTTHTVYWGAMLFALGLEPAKCLYAHGWWTVEGQKMSKSLGNVVDPNLLVDAYGSDALRYVIMAEKAFGADGDFSHKNVQLRYNADLANDIGNLAHRSLSMTDKWLGGRVPALGPLTDADRTLQATVSQHVARFHDELSRMEVKSACEALVAIAGLGNKYIDDQAPWALNKAGEHERLATVMRHCLELCRVSAALLTPFCPERGPELLRRLGVEKGLPEDLDQLSGLTLGKPLEIGEPLFPRLMELPPQIAEALAAVEAQASLKSLGGGKKSKKKQKRAPEPTPEGLIEFDDFAKVQLRAGHVVSAEAHPNADRLLVLHVDIGEDAPRTIVAGIAEIYAPADLVGKTVLVVANLKPRKFRGVRSHGMLLAASTGEGKARELLCLASTLGEVPPGASIS
jgi:methionyl-tRNA synthetase